ncbi:ferric reductase-like transmembrane domain-containing protein [Rhodopila globiformis]|uniref:Oxidoreductase n=1 Tax=Rhodopila globiformis TaxID=1071 RepID=A0A2S6MXR4_RHOGL|nr:ferric reductase-like transmembrane domain-containing protein [Rhodopila globiformis]PPQ27155.1 oxidoreductase [Rhodopila globiformis]
MASVMSALRPLAIPLLALAVPLGFAVWAFPEGLSGIRTAAIVAGWLGCGLLLVSLLLMLREPRLAAWLGGLERMYLWHHRTGVVAYMLLLAHPLLLAANAFADSPARAWETLAPAAESWPVWSGWLALVLLMLGLALTFMRRLPYRAWRWLHAALGAAVLIGLYHLILLGIDEPVAPILTVAALILGWRAVRGDWGLAARPYVVASAHRVAEGVVEIALRPLGDPLVVAPGQFILTAFFKGPDFRGCGEFHPFTVSAVEPDDVLRIGVKALGDCTRRIQSIGPGVAARVLGGFGSFLAEPHATRQFWFAGGIGVTPFLGLLRNGGLIAPTTLLYLYHTEDDAAFLPELRAIAAATPLLTLQAVATARGRPDLDRLLPDAPHLIGCECYLCGPPSLVARLKRILRQRGVTPRHIHFENFDLR